MYDKIIKIKARLFDIQYHTCNGKMSWPPKPGDHGCTLCAEYDRLIAELCKYQSIDK